MTLPGRHRLPAPLVPDQPLTALAPMQDVTDLPFLRVIGRYGPPDYFFTEYFRVHVTSRLEAHILAAIEHHGTGRPVFAQLIGEDLDHMQRTVEALRPYPIAGIDLNMGCPAPKVYKKNVGGGLLRDLPKIDLLLGRLRATCGAGLFTVKMRIGFEDTRHFHEVLDLLDRHQVDLLSLHGRTVKGGYHSEVDYDRIGEARAHLRCPVLANGNITSAAKARAVLDTTGCAGVMIGRSAIRNPWIFGQIRAREAGRPAFVPTLGDVETYIHALWEAQAVTELPDLPRLNRMKKLLNFVGQGVDPEGAFLHAMRRTRSPAELFTVCAAHLRAEGRAALPFADEPYAGILARPNREAPLEEPTCAADY